MLAKLTICWRVLRRLQAHIEPCPRLNSQLCTSGFGHQSPCCRTQVLPIDDRKGVFEALEQLMNVAFRADVVHVLKISDGKTCHRGGTNRTTRRAGHDRQVFVAPARAVVKQLVHVIVDAVVHVVDMRLLVGAVWNAAIPVNPDARAPLRF